MKTKVLLSIAAVAVLSVVSCQKENSGIAPESTPEIEVVKNVEPNPNFTPTKAFSFIGHTDNDFDPETKTSLDGTQVKWAVGDGIYLFDGTAPRAFVSDNGSVSATANFDGSAVVADKYYAIYPSGKISTVESKKVIATTIPTFQTATENSFAPKANVAVAYSESDPTGDAALQFKNIAAVVKFKINAENTDVRKVRLDAINGEDMTGAMNVTFNDDGTFSTASVHANSESCVILESDTDLNPAQTYYMAIKPGTYAGGFKITLIKNDGSFRSINNTTSNTLERNDLVNFGTLPVVSSWKSAKADQLTFATTGVESGSSTYTDWSGKTLTSSAVYAGKSAGQYDAIQIRTKNSDSGLISTSSGGQLSKVVIEWNSNTSSGRTVDVYGKKSAYSSPADLFDAAKQGTKLGSITYGTSTELNITGDYTYVGIRSNDGALYMDKVSVYWGSAPTEPSRTLQTTSITSLSSENVPLNSGVATFVIESNGPYTVSSNASYATVSVSEADVATVTFDNLASGQRSATITVTPAEGASKTVTITQKDAPIVKTVTFTVNTASSVTLGGDKSSFTATLSGTGTLNSGFIQITGVQSKTLTISGMDGKTIVGASVDMKSNKSSGSGSLSLSTNGDEKIAEISSSAFNTDNWYGAWSQSAVTIDLTTTDRTVGAEKTVVLTITGSANSLFFQKLTLEYTD